MSIRDQRVRRQPEEIIDQESEFTVNVTVTKKASTRTKITQPTSRTDNPSWYSTSPPRYDDISLDGESSSGRAQRNGTRREWDNVASKIAARTASARQTTKRFSRDGSSDRVQKPAPRKQNLGLSIDTGVTRHETDSPQQVSLPRPRKQSAKYAQLTDANQNNQQVTTKAPVYSSRQATDLGISLGSKFSPETPTILITPALENRDSNLPGFRGASSIYSRVTLAPYNSTSNPPIPAFPNSLPFLQSRPLADAASAPANTDRDNVVHQQIRNSNGAVFEKDTYCRKTGRVTSTATLFEEDQTPLTAGTAVVDTSGHLTIVTTTPATPHRSRGWWDVIKTPFELSRSFSKFRSPTDGSRTPDLPPKPTDSFLVGRLQEKGYPVESGPEYLTRSQSPRNAPEQHLKQGLADGLDLQHSKSAGDLMAGLRATHNSQALRKLESNERLPHVPTEPLPAMKSHFSQDTEYSTTFSPSSTFSPDDREVPFVLGFNPASAVEQPKQPFSSEGDAGNQQNLVASPAGQTISSPRQDSPQSASTTFSPVGQIAGIGTVTSAKAIVSSASKPTETVNKQTRSFPNSSLAQTSTRSSLTAQIVKQTPPMASAPMYFAPPPFAASREASPARNGNLYEAPSKYPLGRFSDSTLATEKSKKGRGQKLENKMQYFTVCGGKRKDKSGQEKNLNGTKTKKSKKKIWCCCCCCLVFLILVVVAVVVAVLLSRKKHPNSAEASSSSSLPSPATFLTISNFPPIPTGALTIARPNLRKTVSGCVNPQAMWSCAVPKEQQEGIRPNDPDQPNFAVTIKYDDSSSTSNIKVRSAGSGSAEASLWAKSLLVARDTFTSAVFPPSPSPPLLEEQAFLGNTTDGVVSPFEGEKTLFYITFRVPAPVPNSEVKRAAAPATSSIGKDPSATTDGINIPTLTTAIPIPNVNPDGTAQPANLLPFPAYQPLRLYNRGRDDEHYGFYTFFDRNIFLKSIKINNGTQSYSQVPADINGGSSQEGANVRCTWRDTRFKVQIWTNKGTTAKLLPSAGTRGAFARPGTFPYPVTMILDRHGGGLTTKMLFCYGLDVNGHINVNSRQFQREDRAYGGRLVNPASGPFQSVNVSLASGGPGGIDGGDGGCNCEWANWVAT